MSASNFPPMPNALAKRKSPVTRAFCRPNFRYAAGRPRRISPPSLISSWMRDALWIISRAAARSMASEVSCPPSAWKASSVTVGRIRLPPASITYEAMSCSSGSSETMLSRIRASTRASSLAMPKSCEPVIGAVPIRAIESAYITVSWVREVGARRAEAKDATRPVTSAVPCSAAADGLVPDGHDGPHRAVAGRDALDRRRDRLEERVDHVVPVTDPVGHHDDGHHNRHERVDEVLVVHVRCRELDRLRREVGDASQVGGVVLK